MKKHTTRHIIMLKSEHLDDEWVLVNDIISKLRKYDDYYFIKGIINELQND